jgi:hypothetical protein
MRVNKRESTSNYTRLINFIQIHYNVGFQPLEGATTMATTKLPQLTSGQVCQVFGVSSMTLWNWRQGTKSLAPLPVATPKKATEGRQVLRYNPVGLLAWAKKHGVVVAKTPEQVLAGATAAASKPGPKQRVAA